MSLRTLRPGQYAWAPHEPPFSLALELAKETQGAACMKGRGTAIDIAGRVGLEMAVIVVERQDLERDPLLGRRLRCGGAARRVSARALRG